MNDTDADSNTSECARPSPVSDAVEIDRDAPRQREVGNPERPPDPFADRFARLQQAAANAGRGLWTAC